MEPSCFVGLVGNAQAREMLTRGLVRGAVPQVLLLHGHRGVGKGLFADRLARALLGSKKGTPPDLHVLHPDPESDLHAVATLRQLIEETGLPPFEAPCKVFIIHDVEKMLPTSSNTLLKTLEEPPGDTQFILLSSEPSLLLPTILSRCSKVPFYPIADKELIDFLEKKHPGCDAKKITMLSQGSIAKALERLLDKRPILPLEEVFGCRAYTELHRLLHPLSDDFSSLEIDRFFEEILYYVREKAPVRLEEAIPLVTEARGALFHHVKLKTVLERLFIKYLF